VGAICWDINFCIILFKDVRRKRFCGTNLFIMKRMLINWDGIQWLEDNGFGISGIVGDDLHEIS
jgi:hypothetical protein